MTTAVLAPPTSRRGPAAAMLTVAALASVMVVTALWLAHNGLADLASAPATSIGRLSGLLAADTLLIQVILMARVPWLEQTWGQDQLARWHRLVGFTSINLMIVHILFITIGYTIGPGLDAVIAEGWNLITTYPGMLLATAGTLMLLLVAFTSVRAARRKLRYESWHLLHLYAYLGVGLAIPHELWTGTDLTATPMAAFFWWTAYGAAAGCVLVFRVGVPLWRNARHQLRVQTVVKEGPGVFSVWLRGRDLDRLPARSGQFFTWRFLTGPGWTRAHPYSLSAPPRPDLLRITVKTLGDGSAEIRRLRPGTRALIEGPYGVLTGPTDIWRPVTMIASGVGITPLRSLLETLPYPPGGATLIYRARSESDLIFRRELAELARLRGVRVLYLTGKRAGPGRWTPHGHASDAGTLRRLVPQIAEHEVFICGPDEWMTAAATSAWQLGVPPDRVHLERFSW